MKHQLQFLTVLAACGIVKCSQNLIYKAVEQGRIDTYLLKLGTKTIHLFKENDVRKFASDLRRERLVSMT